MRGKNIDGKVLLDDLRAMVPNTPASTPENVTSARVGKSR